MNIKRWKSYQPTSLRDALHACKEVARLRLNLSVERIAERMGLEDHWVLYKWVANGRMPAVLLTAYEHACGCDYVTRWMAATAGKLLVDIPKGLAPQPADLPAMNTNFAQAYQLLADFYAAESPPDTAAILEALRRHMEQVAYHHKNVAAYATPELDFNN